MATNANERGTIKSTRRLLRILEGLMELDGAGVTELSSHLGMPKSSIHKHLKTLESEEMVINTDGYYQLSLRFLEFGGYVRNSNRLSRLGRNRTLDLATNSDCIVNFALEENAYGVWVHSMGENFNRDHVGRHFHLHQNAAGKSILSALDDEAVHEIIDRRGLPASTSETITDEDRLFEELEHIRNRGYAINIEERTESLCGVGAPVYHSEIDQYGALSIGMPRHQVTREDLEETYAKKILATVDELNLQVRFK